MRRECKSAELLAAVLVSDSGNAAVCKYEQLEGTNVCLDLYMDSLFAIGHVILSLIKCRNAN
jgi:hypothetical protein